MPPRPFPEHDGEADAVAAWAASGALLLTGRPDAGPLGPPAGAVAKLRAVADVIEARSAELGKRLAVDPLARLTERAAIAGLTRGGEVSCGGATRLLRAADGWFAVSLARPADLELLPAWLMSEVPTEAIHHAAVAWRVLAATAPQRSVAELVGSGILLGLPIARLPEAPIEPPSGLAGLPVRADRRPSSSASAAPRELADVLVVDLGSLWAGPLCGALLAAAGADVVKVESVARPDGARLGPPAFFDHLNHAKRSVALDLATPAGRKALGELVAEADVVIEASRPRALAQLGIDVDATLGSRRDQVWTSLTGHGRRGPVGDRVGFGDDAAVAGGLVAWDEAGPCFCADAVADPATGLAAAAAILEALAEGGTWLIDASLAGVAAHLAGPTIPVPPGTVAAPPRPPEPAPTAPALGAHTAEVLAQISGGRR